MKAPFLLIAALALTHSAHASAAPLTADERQEKADEAKFRLAEFNKFHPDRSKWTAQDEARFDTLQASAKEAPAREPLPPLHPRAAQAAPARRVAPRTPEQKHREDLHSRLAKAWAHISNAAGGIRDGISDAYETIRDGAEDLAFDGIDATRRIRHDRPFLFSNYVDVVKSGNQISLVYCDSRLFRLDPKNGQHCEKLHKGSFGVAELRSCLKSAPQESKQPGMILNRQLESMDATDREFGVEHFKMFDSKENYAQYLNDCHARLAAHRPAKPRAVAKAAPRKAAIPRLPASPAVPAPAPVVQSDLPPLEFHPVDQAPVQAAPAVEATDTL